MPELELMDWVFYGGVLVLLVLTAAVVWTGTALMGAVFEVKSRPREPMQWCHKHGHFRKGHCIPMVGTLVCPRCYLEALKNADKVELKR